MPSGLEAITASSPASSSTMRKSSPMPLPAYPTPPAPWGAKSPSSSSLAAAPATGKTSQVIEKLTSDNDRLRRELNAERAAKEEIQQQFRTVKKVVDELQEKNDNLKYQFETNDGALARKERRLDDLRASHTEEVKRRKRAEEHAAEMGRKLDETSANSAKQIAVAKNGHKMAETAYSTLSKAYQNLEGQIQSTRQEFQTIIQQKAAEAKARDERLTKLELLLDQKRQQQEAHEKAVQDLSATLEAYRETEDTTRATEIAMRETVEKMRWVMKLRDARTLLDGAAEDTVKENGYIKQR